MTGELTHPKDRAVDASMPPDEIMPAEPAEFLRTGSAESIANVAAGLPETSDYSEEPFAGPEDVPEDEEMPEGMSAEFAKAEQYGDRGQYGERGADSGRAICQGEDSDELLIERIARKRDQQAFSELYDRYSSRIYSYLIHILRSEEDAQDMLQEVFVLVWDRASQYNADYKNVGGWIVRTARNRAVDHLRSKLSHTKIRERSIVVEESVLSNFLVADELPDGDLHKADVIREVTAAMKLLNEEERLLIELSFFTGLTRGEVSEYLGMPIGSVKTKIRRAYGKLATRLQGKF